MTLYFPDISSYQAGIPLSGALVVLCKATEGTSYVNPDYAPAKARAASAGAYFNAYHFLHAGAAAAQASHAHGTAGSVPLMVDFEPSTGSNPTVGDATGFIDAYRRDGGVTHLLYLPEWYWVQLGRPSLKPFADRGMVLVSSHYTGYTDADSGAGWQPYGGMTPAVWQYTSSMNFAGRASVDFNAFRGSYAGRQDAASVAACLAEFRQLATTGRYGTGAPQPAPQPDPPAPVQEDEDMYFQLTTDVPIVQFPCPAGTYKRAMIYRFTQGTEEADCAVHCYGHSYQNDSKEEDFDLMATHGQPASFVLPDDCNAVVIGLKGGSAAPVGVTLCTE